jgi:hypothetical protein
MPQAYPSDQMQDGIISFLDKNCLWRILGKVSIPDAVSWQHQIKPQDIGLAGMGDIEMQVFHLVNASKSGLVGGQVVTPRMAE